MLMLKELESTAPVEIVVEISSRLWKYPVLTKFSYISTGIILPILWKCGKL